MKETKEKGVTLIALVTTIIILLILASVGATSGISMIQSTEFSAFKNELKILQTKVNELNQNNEIDIGLDLNNEQKNILNIPIISNIIFNNKTEDEKEKIRKGFRFCNIDYIKNFLELDGIKRDYIINVEYRYIICYDGYEYNGITYYMIDQIDDEIYNVNYSDKNEKTGDFEVKYIRENDRWKIEVSNIIYNGYINNWQVKYRLDGDTYWQEANGLFFYVNKEGNYYVTVSHGDNINLGSKLVSVINETDF